MNYLYLTFLVLTAVFPQAKGFCGKRLETKRYLILFQCAGYKPILHLNVSVNLAVHKNNLAFTVCSSPRHYIHRKGLFSRV